MIRILKEINFDGDNKYIEAAGLSTDTKPVEDLITGSRFTEVDTGDVYAFDETDTGTWHKIVSGPAVADTTPDSEET